MNKSLVVVAGGTGGHIFPGIAVAQYLREQDWQVSWIGTDDRMEADVVPKHDIEIDFIRAQGVRGNGLKRLFQAPLMIIKAFFAARKILKQRRPAAVLAMGGYVTGPVGLAAKSLGIPLVIHEQNAVAGMSNKLLAKLANSCLGAFPGALPQSDFQVVGNPVRQSLMNITPVEVSSPINILVVGGSLGAQVLNDTLPTVFAELATKHELAVWHQTGKGRSSKVQEQYQAQQLEAKVSDFIDDMDAAYAWADLVICRAGALTVSEVAAAGRMALFVPFPHAVDDHQTANAQYLVGGDAALCMQQGDFYQTAVVEALAPYFQQPQLITEMGKRAKALAKLDATAAVAKQCEQYS
ncbi:undecaprenyldiphospho-muramoylpentapeptide beta-N-acetylglucosaminyltransferase [Pseudoalteromonas sp. T1lg22]|uniref:undecaprenyldiphospho-muramoylpentapeptide beta-N-acetylglucosaminyltransferase n=1 Tax=Pseudoalteromonas sp. T1lg22 TaxID=2077096 RepID=UPI000CF738B5|nr:undecaprenyldiphospho-muramoylpentapeptide beta-N-acetylglucosaminyltransferase [Pseudoalteromonas sp. T1lg22]